MTSKDGKERESVRSSSKIRLTTAGSGERLMTGRVGTGKGNHSDRYMRTVASIHEQLESSKRLET